MGARTTWDQVEARSKVMTVWRTIRSAATPEWGAWQHPPAHAGPQSGQPAQSSDAGVIHTLATLVVT